MRGNRNEKWRGFPAKINLNNGTVEGRKWSLCPMSGKRGGGIVDHSRTKETSIWTICPSIRSGKRLLSRIKSLGLGGGGGGGGVFLGWGGGGGLREESKEDL